MQERQATSLKGSDAGCFNLEAGGLLPAFLGSSCLPNAAHPLSAIGQVPALGTGAGDAVKSLAGEQVPIEVEEAQQIPVAGLGLMRDSQGPLVLQIDECGDIYTYKVPLL